MNTWILEETHIPSQDMRKQESLFAQGNGYLGWRGAFEEGACGDSLEGNYINGFYETYPIKYPEIAYGYPETGQTMLNIMNGKWLRIEVDGEQLHMRPEQVRDYHRSLDFRDGVLRRTFVYTAQGGQRLRCTFERLISFTHVHCGAIRLRLEMLEGTGVMRILSGLDTRVHNQVADKDPRVGAHLPENCFETLEAGAENGTLYASQRTLRSGLHIVCAVHHQDAEAMTYAEQNGLHTYAREATLSAGDVIALEKTIAYFEVDQPAQAIDEARSVGALGFDALVAENAAFLADHWQAADIEVTGDDTMQQGIRFNGFHILQSVGRDGLRNIAAKGLTGEGYEGHYFWDTEMFVIPALLYSKPEICRALLSYRVAHLDEARARARQMNHRRGALFPWRTIGGEECSTFFPGGTAQYHINGDIAYALRSYVLATGDEAFLHEGGAELLFETARLWIEAGHFNPRKGGQFCIDGVTGPDEYTAIVNNNFYTNRIARENLWYACKIYAQWQKECPDALSDLASRIGMDAAEPATWQEAADRMFFPYDEQLGIFLQDDSFADKADWDFAGTPADHHPLLLHYHPLVLYRHKVLKQADTVLADLLFDEYLDSAQIQRDYAYYEPLTTHDSSLSACAYSMVACRIGALEKAYRYFLRTARTDLDDHKGNTRDGVHIANMAGTTMCLLNGFAGLRVRLDGLSLWPQLPTQWEGFALTVRYKECMLRIAVKKQGITLSLLSGDSLVITCYDEPITLVAGVPCSLPYRQREETA